ncbi:MAG: sulfotransferase [Tetrasphaera jenkinsii]|nr:sulfotransferase [Tetrasphaera jenkinsii]
MTDAATSRPAMLVIVGTGRSGSTLLGRLLGALPGAVHVGEVRFLWQRGLIEARLCGCGVPVPECPFWRAVLAEAYGARRPDPAAMHARLTAVTRLRRLPSWLLGERPVTDMAAVLAPLYAAIATISGARVVVDSSKLPTYAALLAAALPTAELDPAPALVHLVRDPRAAAYSWATATPAPDRGPGAVMERRGAARSALLWTAWNGAAAALVRRQSSPARIRYEDLVAQPGAELARMAALVGLSVPRDFIADGVVDLPSDHSLPGNPMRLRSGAIRIEGDDRWRTGLSARDAAVVQVLTRPLAARFGYGTGAAA